VGPLPPGTLLLLALAAAGCSLHGGRFTALEENDILNVGEGLDTDRDYTQGAFAAFTFTDADTPAAARAAAGAIPLFAAKAPVHLALVLGQEIYTPGNLARTDLVPNDRPYAAWLFVGAAVASPVLDADPVRRRDRVDLLELDLGVVGPAARGEQAQNFFHRAFDIPEAEGWDNQNGNEAGVLATWESRWRLLSGDLGRRAGWDVLPRVRVRAGNVRVDGTAGAVARVGWNLPRDFGTMLVDPTGLRKGAPSPEPWVALHAGAEIRGVVHDIFLEGDSHSVTPKRYPYGSVVGASAGWGPLSLVYEQHFLSPQFRERERYHGYVTTMLTWTSYF
jgi:lipid A 3-O-deacylase